MGSRFPYGKGNFKGGGGGVHCKVYGHTAVICAKTAEPIEMPFELWAWMGPRNNVLDGVQVSQWKGAIFAKRVTHCKV